MKKNNLLITLVLLVFFQTLSAQINLLGTLPISNNFDIVKPVALEFAGTKYTHFEQATNTITMYNLDLTVYKTINVPTQPANCNIYYLTEQLFDTDSSDLEYALTYYLNNGPEVNYYVRIYKEDGTLLFSQNKVIFGGGYEYFNARGQIGFPIFNSPQGTIMIISRASANSLGLPPKTWFYELPGHLYCPPCDGGSNFTGGGNESYRMMNNSDYEIGTYPNPASTYTKVYFELPENITTGELVFFNTLGNEVKRFTVDDLFNYIQVSTDDLPSGTYSYKIITTQGASEGKQLVVVQ